ncbi:MAG: hypothetical protein ABI718_07320 [Acidobacteriota bacterium]
MIEIGLAAVVPTRNRADLAIKATESLLRMDCFETILISDNSNEEQESSALEAWASRNRHVTYVRPPKALSMAAHWDWAIGQLLDEPQVTHALLATDRMIMYPRLSELLQGLVQRHPKDVIIFTTDFLWDHVSPPELLLTRWSGKLLRLRSRRLLEAASGLRLHNPYPIPRLMNSIVPVNVFADVRKRYGSICNRSIAPDYAFGFRSLAVTESVLFIDRPFALLHATYRSNGTAFARGIASRDRNDFLAMLDSSFNADAPIPIFPTITNTILHEYGSASKMADFPAIDFPAYLRRVGSEVERLENPEERDALRTVLKQLGATSTSPPAIYRLRQLLILFAAPKTQPFWRLIGRRMRLYPPGDAGLQLSDPETAIAYAESHPRRRHILPLHLRAMLPAYEVITDGSAAS